MKLYKNQQTGLILSEADLQTNFTREALTLWEDDRNDFSEQYETFDAFLSDYKIQQQDNYRSFEKENLDKWGRDSSVQLREISAYFLGSYFLPFIHQ